MKQQGKISNLEALKLVKEYKESSKQNVLGTLYAPYMKMVLAIGLKYFHNQTSAEDLVMKVYEKLGKKLLHSEIDNFSSWLYTVAKNECLMELRKTKKEIPTENITFYQEKFMENEYSLHLLGESSVDKQFSALQNCLSGLKEEQKICVEAFYYENKSYKEIEEATGYDLKKVKSYIQNGKRNLKRCVEKNNVKH